MWSSKTALVAVLAAVAVPAAGQDLRELEVQGQRGQSLEQTRRDRYECHNWAVEQTGEAPAAVGTAPESSADGKRELRRERIDRALVGAVIGGAVGSILGNNHWHHSGDHAITGAAAGAAAGAAIGAATAGSGRRAERETQAEEPSDYLRALTACLEGRGYSVAMPTAELTARR